MPFWPKGEIKRVGFSYNHLLRELFPFCRSQPLLFDHTVRTRNPRWRNNKSEEPCSPVNCAVWMLKRPQAQGEHILWRGRRWGYANDPTHKWGTASCVLQQTWASWLLTRTAKELCHPRASLFKFLMGKQWFLGNTQFRLSAVCN